MSLLERFACSSHRVLVYAWLIVCCVLPVNPDSLQLLSAEISWLLWCPCNKATDWLLFSAPTISVPWVESGVCFFSFHTRHLFSLIGLVFLSWTPGFSSNNFLCAAVLLAEPETCKYKPPGCEAGSVLSIPSVRDGVRLGFLPCFPAGWCPWMLPCHVWAVWQWLCAAALTSEPARVSRDAGLAVHGGVTQAAPALSPVLPRQPLCCATAETSCQLLSKFYFCVCIDTDLLK